MLFGLYYVVSIDILSNVHDLNLLSINIFLNDIGIEWVRICFLDSFFIDLAYLSWVVLNLEVFGHTIVRFLLISYFKNNLIK